MPLPESSVLCASPETNATPESSVLCHTQSHPWLNGPLGTYEAAWQKLEKGQVEIDKVVSAGGYRSKQRDAAISNLIKVGVGYERVLGMTRRRANASPRWVGLSMMAGRSCVA